MVRVSRIAFGVGALLAYGLSGDRTLVVRAASLSISLLELHACVLVFLSAFVCLLFGPQLVSTSMPVCSFAYIVWLLVFLFVCCHGYCGELLDCDVVGGVVYGSVEIGCMESWTECVYWDWVLQSTFARSGVVGLGCL